MRTWVDASVIIALDAIGELDLLRKVLGEVFVTRQIEAEVRAERASSTLREAIGAWIRVRSVQGSDRRFRALGLGAGEASFFLTAKGDFLVLDEVPARRAAEAEGRAYTGLLGLLVAAARDGTIPKDRARDLVQRLVNAGFRMSIELYEQIRSELE